MGWFRCVRAHGAVEGGVAVGEHAAVERAQPVALGVGGDGHGHDRALQGQAAGGALEGGVAEGEDAAVGAGQQVPVAVGGGGAGEDGRVERLGHGRVGQADAAEADHARRRCRRAPARPRRPAPCAVPSGRGRRPARRARGPWPTARVTSDAHEPRPARRCRGADRPTPMVPPPSAHDVDSARCARGRCAGAVTKSLRSRPLNAGVGPAAARRGRRVVGHASDDPFGRSGRAHGRMGP